MSTDPTYYLAYKTKENCFKHVKITDMSSNANVGDIFNINKNGSSLKDDEFNSLTRGTPGSGGTPGSEGSSFYLLQKTPPGNTTSPACTTIVIRKVDTNNTSALEELINIGENITVEELISGSMQGGGGSPSSPLPKKGKSPYGGTTMKNRIKPKNKNNYKNKQKSNTRKN